MSQLGFAYRAVVRVYMDDSYEQPRLSHESLEEHLLTDSAAYDGHNEQEFILDGVQWPGEGYFSVWIVGKFIWSTDYWGETDMDVEPDVCDIGPVSMSEMHAITGYECYQPPKPMYGYFTFD